MPTKREVLKVVMSIFDPLGMLGNYMVRAKILLQDIWRSSLNWDEEISQALFKRWKIWLQGLQQIKDLKIDRCYNVHFKQIINIQLHIFCDASEQAFATVAYFRFEIGNEIKIVLCQESRNQVAPLKRLTIPRLELQAAVMGSRLAKTIKKRT